MEKYIIVLNYGAIRKDTLEKSDLVDAKKRYIDAIINTEDNTYFDAENNEWKKIKKI